MQIGAITQWVTRMSEWSNDHEIPKIVAVVFCTLGP